MMPLNQLNKTSLTPILLRVGLAVVFIYASLSSFKNPQDWIGYLPHFAREQVSATTLLHVFSVYEMFLALWLLSGKYVKPAAALATVTLTSIVLFNFSLFAISFRDIGLIFAGAALYFSKK